MVAHPEMVRMIKAMDSNRKAAVNQKFFLMGVAKSAIPGYRGIMTVIWIIGYRQVAT
jgi:hypothetical protein